MRLLTILWISVWLTACATADYSTMTPDEIAKQIQVSDSEFQKTRSLNGPVVAVNPQKSVWGRLMLSATHNKETGSIMHGIVALWSYTAAEWFYFDGVNLPGGEELTSSPASRKVDRCHAIGCTYTETVSALIGVDELLLLNGSDLRLMYTTSRGGVVVTIPGNYVEGYLKGVNQLSASYAKASK